MSDSVPDEHPLLDSSLLQQLVEKETPELESTIDGLNLAISALTAKLKPLLDKVRGKQLESTKDGMSYLEMKYNLMLSYCQFLAFFVLQKLEGKPVSDHPVIGRLIHIKTLLERLRTLDQKL